MRVAILLLCSAVGFGQSAASPQESKAQRKARCGEEFGLSIGAHGQQSGPLDILSDTQGVDFGPYLQRILQDVRENWYHLIPESAEMKKGKLAIEFAIRKDGKLAEMCLVATSGDVALDRAAWDGITASNPLQPLPSEFTGPYLAMRFRFYYNPDKGDLDGSAKEISPERAHPNEGTPISSTPSIPSKSGVAVNISSSGDSNIPCGESRVLVATVTGTKKTAVKWSISGLCCANSSCGEMVGNLYFAPSAPPNHSEVTVTAVSKADSTAKASVIVHIVGPPSKIASKP